MKRERVLGLNPNVFFLGIVSFLTDVSSEMIFTLLPLFLSNVLGAAPTIIGLIEGVGESAASVLRIASGWLSDKMGKRKSLTFLGYVLSVVAKPFMYLATGWGLVLGVRLADRTGKGIRSAPRDALIADSISAAERGKGFGLHRAMDTLGAVVGIALAVAVVFLLQREELALTQSTYQWLVLVGVMPAVLALVMFFFVREPKRGSPRGESESHLVDAVFLEERRGFDRRFKIFLVILVVFTLGNSSDAFLILRAQNVGSPVLYTLLMLLGFNIAYAFISLPAGVLSDKLGKRRLIALGWFIYALAYLGFALASAPWHIALLFIVYGVYYGAAEGVTRAFVADLVPAERRGTAYGLYHGVVGVTLLPSSIIAGWLWQTISPATPFFLGAALACAAMIGLMALIREQKTAICDGENTCA